MSTNTIETFKQNLTNGGVRANQFRVFLNLGEEGAQNSVTEFVIEAASLPGSYIDITPVMYRGREVKLAGERRFDNWQVTVINDNFKIHSALENWMHQINNIYDNSGTIDPVSYVRSFEVHQLDRNDVVMKKYDIINAWPVSVSPIQLSFADNNTVEKFQVEFAYDNFKPSTLSGS